MAPPARGRGRPREFDRDAALARAMHLFWLKGFEATSIADLTTAMNIGAPSLYAAFGSKESLYAEALRYYEQHFGHRAWGRFESAPTARAAVRQLLLDSAEALAGGERGGPKGCMVTLSAVDGEDHAALSEAVRASRRAVVDRLTARFARAVEAGEIPTRTDLHALARFVQAVQGGMSLLARDGATRDELAAVARLSMATWDATVSRPRQPVRTDNSTSSPKGRHR